MLRAEAIAEITCGAVSVRGDQLTRRLLSLSKPTPTAMAARSPAIAGLV
ncbi:MAG: hypothetical protein NZ699_00480 [Roseiflexus sp.]|nr:hypothetical protein [Roseiflexus sp.]MCS7287585.1 hypothetical protein [Roseiflexus sp.]MDW8146130.1 hypothetical protein [Roseiflexaceae bacterium]